MDLVNNSKAFLNRALCVKYYASKKLNFQGLLHLGLSQARGEKEWKGGSGENGPDAAVGLLGIVPAR